MKIKGIDLNCQNASGHFKPSEESLKYAKNILNNKFQGNIGVEYYKRNEGWDITNES